MIRYVFMLRMMFVCTLIASCSPTSQRLNPAVSNPAPVTQLSGGLDNFDLEPKIDILFVVDDSMSMKTHQYTLSRSIDGFVNAFVKNEIIDFHLGVLMVYDSAPVKKDEQGQCKETDDHCNFIEAHRAKYPRGQLLKLRASEKEDDTLPLAPYVTSETPDLVKVLKNTIKVGTHRGPEYEEAFSPVAAALSRPGDVFGEDNEDKVSFYSSETEMANKGFYRPDAHLAIVFITDADDGTLHITPEKFRDFLLKLKGGDKDRIDLYAVTFDVNTVANDSCRYDPGIKLMKEAEKINKSVRLLKGHQFSICINNYGPQLSKIGEDLSTKVAAKKIILRRGPRDESKPMTVYYGTQKIPSAADDLKTGWRYDPIRNMLILSGKNKLKKEPGAQLAIDYTPVVISNGKLGLTKEIGQ